MTKIPSVEEKVEAFTKTIKGEFPCQMIGGVAHYDILLLKEELKASLTADRTVLLTELREEIEGMKSVFTLGDATIECDCDYNIALSDVTAHLDELINPTTR